MSGRGAAVGPAVALALLIGSGCSGDDGATVPAPTTTTAGPATTAAPTTATAAAPTTATALGWCGADRPEQVGTVEDPDLDELSGLAASRRHLGVLWAVEDSGNDAVVVALDPSGQVLAEVVVTGARNHDWEDVALLPPATTDGPDRLAVADLGDNRAERDEVALWVLDEPAPDAQVSAAAERWVLRWPDGPRDAEALLADPASGELVVLSKQLLGGTVVARVPATAGPDRPVDLEVVATVATGPGEGITGGTVAADGSAVAARTYLSLLVWPRPPGWTLVDALTRLRPCRAPSPQERQGEAVAALASGELVTVGEAATPALWMVRPRP